MGLGTQDGDQGRWPGAQNFYGGQDLARDIANGTSASTIKAYMANNPDKFRSQVTRDMINNLRPSPPPSSGGGGGGGGGGSRSETPSRVEIPTDNPFVREEEPDVTEIEKGYYNPDAYEDFQDIISKGGGQNVFQSAIQDNRMSNIGNNSVFGDNAQVGINNAVQNVNQSVEYGLNLERRKDAKERAKDWLALSAVAG